MNSSKLIYREYGDPLSVVEKIDATIPLVQANQLLVKMLAAPVNPADINTIQGKYPSKPTLPAIPGNEGVGEVVQIGTQVTNFSIGDRVVPMTTMVGTWQSHTILEAVEAFKVPADLGLVEASTLTVNPCTAYRMLVDFGGLTRGDVVIQNGGNSACGQNVIQLCKIWGYQNISIIRDRPKVSELKKFLLKLGASHVMTEEELRTTQIFKNREVPRPKLALNCVGGKSATELMRTLEHSGTIVTYGGMSREPVTVGTAMLIFKNLQVRGFWMTDWSKKHAKSPERRQMLEELVEFMRSKKLKGPVAKMVHFDNYKEALTNTLSDRGMTGLKYIINFSK